MRQFYIDLVPWCNKQNIFNLLRIFILYPTFRAIVINRIAWSGRERSVRYFLCKIYNIHLRNKYHIDIPLSVIMGNAPMFPHEGPIIINGGCRIGDNVTIFPNVLIGSVRGREGKGCGQTIGNNVVICSGAKILGEITIPNNVFIAPNAVVIKDQEANTTIAGVPSKVISLNGEKNCKFYSYNRF